MMNKIAQKISQKSVWELLYKSHDKLWVIASRNGEWEQRVLALKCLHSTLWRVKDHYHNIFTRLGYSSTFEVLCPKFIQRLIVNRKTQYIIRVTTYTLQLTSTAFLFSGVLSCGNLTISITFTGTPPEKNFIIFCAIWSICHRAWAYKWDWCLAWPSDEMVGWAAKVHA